ncbi:MAG TPA: archaemetzincin family Zn-dependent metalloprotease [Anaeromyxobacteraceae bacterium]|nr:archaemetzincin family Zn-dependent metalloprotease [Anaeromyxobacteraceae bacterium]
MEGIHLWWIGEGGADPRLLEHVRAHLDRAFGLPVALWSAAEPPREAYDPRRRQWSSTRILRWLLDHGPGAGKVLGVTDVDLFIPILTFVFGEAQLGGGAAVVSTARLHDPPEMGDDRVVRQRLAKEAVHELGHAFGLTHCGTPRCVMSRSPSVRDVDLKRDDLCAECRARLARPVERGPA